MSAEVACLKCGSGLVPGCTAGQRSQAVMACVKCPWFTYPALTADQSKALHGLWMEEGTKLE